MSLASRANPYTEPQKKSAGYNLFPIKPDGLSAVECLFGVNKHSYRKGGKMYPCCAGKKSKKNQLQPYKLFLKCLKICSQ